MNLNDFGLLSFGTTLAAILTVTSEFGYALMAERDISQNKFPINKYIINAFIQKTFFIIISIIGGIVYVRVLYTGSNAIVGMIFILIAVISSCNVYFLAIFRSSNLFKIESIITSFYAAFLTISVTIYLIFDLNLYFIIINILIARFCQLIFLCIIFCKKFGFPHYSFDKEIQKYFIKNSFSFGVHYIIGILYFSLDNQLLTFYSGNEAVAIYQSIFRIVLILISFADLLNNVFLPYLSSKFKYDKENFLVSSINANKIVILVGLVLFVVLNLFSRDIVIFLYSHKYVSGLTLVLPLSFVLIFRIMCSVYAVLLTISDHQNSRVVVVIISLFINLVLNIWLIPKFGYLGAAYVSMLTHFVLVGLYISYAYKYLGTLLINGNLIFSIVFTFLFIAGIQYFNPELNFLNNIILMLTWLVVISYILRKEDFSGIKEMLGKFYS